MVYSLNLSCLFSLSNLGRNTRKFDNSLEMYEYQETFIALVWVYLLLVYLEYLGN